jgi:hypothetical protein
MADIGIFEQTLQIGNCSFSAPVESILPESFGPSNVLDIHASEFCVSAAGGISQSVGTA